MKKALILEGGAKRGIYTAGVLDILLENSIMPEAVFGVSAGAIHGCSYVAGQKERSIRYNLKYGNDPRFMSIKNWVKTGNVVDTKFCYHELPDILDPFDHESFEKAKCQFFVVCSNIETGKPEYILCPTLRGENIDYLRASASLPFLSQVVEIGGKKLLDGGICDSIPLKVYNAELDFVEAQEKLGNILVLRPSETIKIGKMEQNLDIVKQMYELGRKDAMDNLEKVRKFWQI